MKTKISIASAAIFVLCVIGVLCTSGMLRAQDDAEEKKTVAGEMLKKHKVKQYTINLIDSKVFGKLPVKSYHQKVHQNGNNCELCHGVKEPVAPPDTRNCSNCHGTPEDVAKRTEKLEPNPHNPPHWGTELPCDTCHKEHGKSKFYCKNCHHFDYQVP